ncbi:hypothetical protein FCL54_06615 [Pseudalkalibacillus caeni]|uniref:Uncharacterized protein n=2 Tax=Exobacillus caeni TaxID=2574798 RepID=A0A5R9F7W9_9BACL|nr:hypothetical protein FCL54_06615 [Pseudalkalibacillus caeni]
MRKRNSPLEILLWSIALPGFGQVLNGKLIKGILFIFLEILINVNAKLNLNILYSFQGNIDKAIEVTDYQWAMFYPCLYLFAIFDSYYEALKQSDRSIPSLLSIPFVSAVYLSTIGVMFSDTIPYIIPIPPTFIPLLAMVIGVWIGNFIRLWIIHKRNVQS